MNAAIFMLVVFVMEGDASTHDARGRWSYRGDNGPKNWANLPNGSKCRGLMQSPIDIQTNKAIYQSYEPFEMIGYDETNLTSHPLSILNNGQTVEVSLPGGYLVTGGGLPSTYKAVQFHLHWGSNSSRGSEHTINGKHYAGEMHIVHYDFMNFEFVPEAIKAKDGLAFLSVWIKQGRYNTAWERITRQLHNIRYTKDPHVFDTPFSISSLLPNDLTRFYRYRGSLTKPPCHESVVWTMFEEPIELSRRQIGLLRRLSDLSASESNDDNGPKSVKSYHRLVNNYRPTQRLWFRKVYQSWPHNEMTSPPPMQMEPVQDQNMHGHVTHHSSTTQFNSPNDNSQVGSEHNHNGDSQDQDTHGHVTHHSSMTQFNSPNDNSQVGSEHNHNGDSQDQDTHGHVTHHSSTTQFNSPNGNSQVGSEHNHNSDSQDQDTHGHVTHHSSTTQFNSPNDNSQVGSEHNHNGDSHTHPHEEHANVTMVTPQHQEGGFLHKILSKLILG